MNMANRDKFQEQNHNSGKKSKAGQFRIIGGQWKGRKLRFIEVEGLRPSLDRVRETLFNWLQWDIRGVHCLDLFAGSGALGIEALSRGAASVQFVELHKKAADQLRKNLDLLNTDNGSLHSGDALEFIKSQPQAFDIVFIDPPFHKGIAQQAIDLIENSQITKSETLIYIEVEQNLELVIPENWQLLKDKKAGQLLYKLYQVS